MLQGTIIDDPTTTITDRFCLQKKENGLFIHR